MVIALSCLLLLPATAMLPVFITVGRGTIEKEVTGGRTEGRIMMIFGMKMSLFAESCSRLLGNEQQSKGVA